MLHTDELVQALGGTTPGARTSYEDAMDLRLTAKEKLRAFQTEGTAQAAHEFENAFAKWQRSPWMAGIPRNNLLEVLLND